MHLLIHLCPQHVLQRVRSLSYSERPLLMFFFLAAEVFCLQSSSEAQLATLCLHVTEWPCWLLTLEVAAAARRTGSCDETFESVCDSIRGICLFKTSKKKKVQYQCMTAREKLAALFFFVGA